MEILAQLEEGEDSFGSEALEIELEIPEGESFPSEEDVSEVRVFRKDGLLFAEFVF